MQIGILSQICNRQDMEVFKRNAKRRKINIQFFTSSSLVIKIHENKLCLLDSTLQPVNLQGVINWEPYPVFDEIEMVCKTNGIPFLNRIDAVRTARNKMLTSILLAHNGLPQPDTVYYNNPTIHKAICENLTMPFVYKRKNGTQGRGANKFLSFADFNRFIGHKVSQSGYYMQSYVPNDGWDIRVVVVGNQVLGAIRKTAAEGEWRTHTLHGGKTVPFPVTEELEQLALQTVNALGLDFAGIDVIVDSKEHRYKILEVNAVPGLNIFRNTTGICIASAIMDLITLCPETSSF